LNEGQTILAQITSYIPRHTFSSIVDKYQGDYRVRTFTCWEQFSVVAFAQLTYGESLKDIEICLRAMRNKLYHVGIRSDISRSTSADANEKRDCGMYADFANLLINEAKELYRDERLFSKLDATIYALDSTTTIDLCLSLFP